MPVERVNSFLEFQDLGVTPSLGIESSHIERCVFEICRRKWMGVFGCPGFGFGENNLDFLTRLPQLLQVWFWDVELDNVDGIYALHHLKYFGVHPKRPGIDFSRLPELETMVWFYNKKDSSIESLSNLRNFDIWHFNPRSHSFEDLRIPASVERLGIFWANPKSLAGFPVLPSLKRLEIHHCRNLVSLERLAELSPLLETLIVSTSSKVAIDSFPQHLPNLKTVVINGRRIKG